MALLGAIADDFTGATDLANNLVREGMRTVQLISAPREPLALEGHDALVVALKSRSIPPEEAVALSLEALSFLQGQGCRQFFFKYCSTFDSTKRGNIGPVAEAILEALGAEFTIACPAFPATGRTLYQGHLFVRDRLLNESGMENHPANPMRDADLARVLARQTRSRVGLVPYGLVHEGSAAIERAFSALREKGVRHAIVDALFDDDLRAIGEASRDLPLVTGGSGIAIGLPANFREAGLLAEKGDASSLPRVTGPEAVLSGSCSDATQAQVGRFIELGGEAFELDPLELAANDDHLRTAIAWARARQSGEPVLVHATAPPERVRDAQARLGAARAGGLVEDAFAAIARALVDAGVRRLVVAGGETAGAVVEALGIKALAIGPQIDPGVPATVSISGPRLALALKSGNFGGVDFFHRAFATMP